MFLLRLDSVRLPRLDRVAELVEVGAEVVDEVADRRAQLLLVGVLELAGLGDPLEQLGLLGAQPDAQVAEELAHPLGLDPIEEASRARVDRRDLVGHLERLALLLLQHLDQPLAAVQRLLRLGVELGAELGERLQVAVLGEVEAQLAGDLLHRLRLRVAAHPRDRDANVDRGANAGVEEIGLEEDLPVGDRDHVGRDVGGDVARLRLDDRQRRQRAAAELVVQLHRPLQQPRVQVEDVARVGLAAGRAPQQQRHLAVGVGVLGQVVVDAERGPAVVEEVLAHRAAGIGGDELDRRRLVGGGGDDDRVLHRAVFLQHLLELDDGRHPLPDRDVDADQVLVAVVDDRVDRDRRLAGLTVADDQLSLAAADRDHPVDRHQPRLHRLGDRLTLDHARRLELGGAGLRRGDLTLVVERAAERVDQAPQQLLSDRDPQQLTRPLHRVALDDLVPLAEEHGADVVLLEVEGEAGDAVRQLEHLQRHAVVEAVDARDPVGDREHCSDLSEVGAAGIQSLDPLAKDRGDLVGLDLH